MQDFPPRAFAWFEGLERENTRDYFARTREIYDADVRGALEALLDALADERGGDVKVFRQHRDLRFSRDKSPYKTRTYGVVTRLDGHALYLELSSAGLYAGTGAYRLEPESLARFRAAVDDDAAGAELEALVAVARADGLEVAGATLRGAPRGYPRDHPRIALLRHTSLIAGARLEPGPDGIRGARARGHAERTWRSASGIVGWLDDHVGR